jgi:hypothetical protein
MALEDRNGRSYYYRKHRIGDRVISEYCGSGLLAELYAEADEQKRRETELERRTWREERESVLEIDRQVNQTMDTCRTLADMLLLASGYHTHKGTWRRKRVKRD